MYVRLIPGADRGRSTDWTTTATQAHPQRFNDDVVGSELANLLATGRIPRSRPMLDRMKENSPICPSAMAIVSAVLKEYPRTRTCA